MDNDVAKPADENANLSSRMPIPAAKAGLYIHVPFCRAKCAYCDFYSITRLEKIDAFIEALLVELNLCPHRMLAADTVYFGGGTPSVLTPAQIEKVLDGVLARFPVAADAEVTLEVNPETVSMQDLADVRTAGINRLNIGLQSIDDETLALLGRIHTAKTGIDTYRRSRAAGFDNVGLDLIYAVPGQNLNRWESELADVVRLAPDHLSCYTLTIEPQTPMARQVQDGKIALLDEQTVGDLFCATADFLNENGYQQYEVSNFARHDAGGGPDRRSRHNRKYWTFAPYLGFGPAAHSFVEQTRWWNHASLEDYLAALKTGASPVAERETLTRDQQMIEFVYLGLRQTEGIDLPVFASRFQMDFSQRFDPQLTQLVDEGLVEKLAHRVRLTPRGMRFLESVVGRLIS